MTLTSSLASIKINDNTIDIGNSSDGTTPVTYTYTNLMIVNGSSKITNNIFSGCIGNSTTYLLQITASSIITNNIFIRGAGSPITKYIECINNVDHLIKDNIFDQSTVDGTIDVLVTGLSPTSIYSHNKNQIQYIPISMAGGTHSGDSASANIIANGTVTVSSAFNYLTFFQNVAAFREFYVNFDLNSMLPEGIKILDAKFGVFDVFSAGSILSSVNSFVRVTIAVQAQASANYTVGTNSILDVKNKQGAVLDSVDGDVNMFTNYAAVQVNTVYGHVDIQTDASDPNNFIVKKDNCITAQMFIACTISTLGAGQDWVVSPIVLKCIW